MRCERRILRYHSLKRGRVRQTWNKYNLYNLHKMRSTVSTFGTFFQQKWAAKAATRAYHGEHIKEKQWERMFSRRLLSAVNMDPAYMAKYDGSEQAAGRGSGRDVKPAGKPSRDGKVEVREVARNTGNAEGMTPYMQMTFAPQERRLDIAVYRALFASSARQARQFVVHGAVKVNGKKMQHPGYLLNPGDLFQVDPEKVMIATGRKKTSNSESISAPKEPAAEEEAEPSGEGEATEATGQPAEELSHEQLKAEYLEGLRLLHQHAKKVIDANKEKLSGGHKKEIRELSKKIKEAMNKARRAGTDVQETGDDMQNLATLMSQLELTPAERKELAKEQEEAETTSESTPTSTTTPDYPQLKPRSMPAPTTTNSKFDNVESQILQRLLEEEKINPYDPSKPYATPWRPRPYMSAFAFIPRYLEVHPKICAAVYLRHPVARPGKSEIPTPFDTQISQLAFNWYLRRR
ncbi:putative mitochondrial SSU ribosomal protein S4 precursor [Triangularia verruculosa]|uniref:Small ribosomal subunit protein uS4m n=1 Tax=Triangularia verruculosa TaxID=2587418 RepID=A0AAN6XP11_9PEZI|nr:putative mitochondrial SSU ribosomal protein S4 precursor [Triangularia verruculosa]